VLKFEQGVKFSAKRTRDYSVGISFMHF